MSEGEARKLSPAFGHTLQALDLSPDKLPNLSAAYSVSTGILTDLSKEIKARLPPDEHRSLDVVLVGSTARLEAREASDLDYLIISHSLPASAKESREMLRVVDQYLQRSIMANPGATGMFGTIIGASDITERIGLEQDTNLSHSRRVLLLEESRSVYQPDLHRALRTAIVQRYLADYEQRDPPKTGAPRFLLNDVMRYWRTISVDYQAKRWEGDGRTGEPGWGLRYFKLLISRKLSYAAALVPLLLSTAPSAEDLVSEYEKPALARLTGLATQEKFAEKLELRGCLLIADDFIGKLSNKEFRQKLKTVESVKAIEEDAELRGLREDAKRLQNYLQKIFFESELLGELARRYLSF